MDMSELQRALLPSTENTTNRSTTTTIRSCLSVFWRALVAHATDFAILAGPLLALILYFTISIDDDTGKSVPMLASMAWIFLWWITEAVPLAITALVPLFLFPFLQIETASVVSKSYINDTIFLILGSFILASSVRYHNLHKRFALRTVLLFGSDPRLLLFGFCIGAAFISMWVDNAAAAAMLMPMAVGVQQKVHAGFHPQEEEEEEEGGSSRGYKISPEKDDRMSMDLEKSLKVETDFCKAVVISIAVAVTIGGMATLTGNAVNLVFTGIWETDFPKESPIYFLQWMLFAVPFALLLVLVLWVLMCVWFCPPSSVKPMAAALHSAHLEEELAKLGPVSSDQIIILVIFGILIVLWMTKTLTGGWSGWASLFDDYPANGSITILMAVLLFVIPNPNAPTEKLMNWSQCKDIPWNILLLLGGGFALADGIKSSGLSDVISSEMNFLEDTPYWLIAPSIALVTSVVTEFTSNSAIASIFVPLAAELALSMNYHPLYLMVPATLGSQLSFMLPVATGPNAMAYATDSIRTMDMAAPGFVLKIVGIILISIFMPTLGPYIFNTNSTIKI